jgi:hypothetical protein
VLRAKGLLGPELISFPSDAWHGIGQPCARHTSYEVAR